MTDEPGLVRKAVNLGKAVARHVADGAKKLDEEDFNQRLEICKSCPEYIPERTACRLCGCDLKIKASWRSEYCPLAKWPLPAEYASKETEVTQK